MTELSRPSSLEVEEIIHQLVGNILSKFFKDDSTSDFVGDSAIRSLGNLESSDDESCDTIGTSRDYLAKLLFWLVLRYACFLSVRLLLFFYTELLKPTSNVLKVVRS